MNWRQLNPIALLARVPVARAFCISDGVHGLLLFRPKPLQNAVLPIEGASTYADERRPLAVAPPAAKGTDAVVDFLGELILVAIRGQQFRIPRHGISGELDDLNRQDAAFQRVSRSPNLMRKIVVRHFAPRFVAVSSVNAAAAT